MKEQILDYIKENDLEKDGMIFAVNLKKIAKHFNIDVIDVMFILRYNR